MAASPKEKFDAAVNVIHSLPKNGELEENHLCSSTFIMPVSLIFLEMESRMLTVRVNAMLKLRYRGVT